MTAAARPVEAPGPGDARLRDVLIVDDHPIVLQGFRALAEAVGTARVHEARDVVSGYRTFHRHRPGLVVTDLCFREDGLSGLSLIRRIRALEPAARILALSMHRDPVVVARVLECGALGFVLKDAPAADILAALTAVADGRSYLPHAVALDIAMLNAGARDLPLARLTGREMQIFVLIGKGRSYGEIASILALSYRSIVNAASAVRDKLGAGSTAELMQIAAAHDTTRP